MATAANWTTVVIIFQHTQISDHCIVHLKVYTVVPNMPQLKETKLKAI